MLFLKPLVLPCHSTQGSPVKRGHVQALNEPLTEQLSVAEHRSVKGELTSKPVLIHLNFHSRGKKEKILPTPKNTVSIFLTIVNAVFEPALALKS